MKCLCVPQRTHSCFTGLSIAFLFLWMWNENIDAIYICSYCWKKLIFHSINRMLFLWRGPGFKGILFFMSFSWFKMSGDSGINSWAGNGSTLFKQPKVTKRSPSMQKHIWWSKHWFAVQRQTVHNHRWGTTYLPLTPTES